MGEAPAGGGSCGEQLFRHRAAPSSVPAAAANGAPPVALIRSANGTGYGVVTADGARYDYGTNYTGGVNGLHLNTPIVDAIDTGDGKGTWYLGADGGIFTSGTAPYRGNPIKDLPGQGTPVALIRSTDGTGYAVVTSNGARYDYGTNYTGGVNGLHLNAPIVDAIDTGDGKGTWYLGADGGIFTSGTAPYRGNPIKDLPGQGTPVALIRSTDGTGYTVVTSNGARYDYGTNYTGGVNGLHLNAPIVDAIDTGDGKGTWYLGADGGIFTSGTAPYRGNPIKDLGNPSPSGVVGPVDTGAYPFRMSMTFARNTTDHLNGRLRFTITDATGRTIANRSYRAGSGTMNGSSCNQIGRSQLPPGNYAATYSDQYNGSVIKGHVFRLSDMACSGVTRTQLFIHSEETKDGGQSCVAGKDAHTCWEGDGDYASNGCVKVSPADIADLRSVYLWYMGRSHSNGPSLIVT